VGSDDKVQGQANLLSAAQEGRWAIPFVHGTVVITVEKQKLGLVGREKRVVVWFVVPDSVVLDAEDVSVGEPFPKHGKGGERRVVPVLGDIR
jgi:hypothetical protein